MIPFSPPRIDQKTIDEVTDTLRSGWVTTGPKTKRFEKELANYTGAPRVLCVSSATAGLELMLRWFGVGPGDEVILPVYTYCATANVVVHCGAKPVFVDVRPDDFNMDVEAVFNAITERTKVIMPVDFAGMPCDYDAIMKLVNAGGIKKQFRPSNVEQTKLGRILVLADAAHSVGGRYKGKMTGTLADLSVFSFHAVKNLTTAEGGAVALNLPGRFDPEEMYQYLNIISLHGQSKDALAKSKKGGWRYDVIYPGYKANMTDIQASIGLVELERYERETLPRRREIFQAYDKAFAKKEWAELPLWEDKDRCSSYHVYPLRIKNISEQQRDAMIDGVFAREVSVNVHFQPLPLLSQYKGMDYKMENYPVAWQNYSREISLPVYYDLKEEEVETVTAAVSESVEKALDDAQ
jgi:dTDP-4-amino-4,6-dideoxygalactose transaminase